MDHWYANCTRTLHEMVKYIDSQLASPITSSLVKQRLLGPGAELNSDKRFASMLGFLYAYQKEGGLYEGNPSLASICDYMEWSPVLDNTTGTEGLTSSRGGEFLVDRLASFRPWIEGPNKLYNTSCRRDEVSTVSWCSLSGSLFDSPDNEVSWYWQQCSELGYFTPSSCSPHSLVPDFLSSELLVATICQKFFPGKPEYALRDLTERVRSTNEQFGGLKMRPSNVFWTTGEYDPYRSASPLARTEIDTGDGSVNVTQEIPRCNVSSGPDAIFGLVLENSGHCVSIKSNNITAWKARRLFADALHEWLECF